MCICISSVKYIKVCVQMSIPFVNILPGAISEISNNYGIFSEQLCINFFDKNTFESPTLNRLSFSTEEKTSVGYNTFL